MSTRSFVAVMLALLGLGLLGLWYWDSTREHRLLIAGGQRSGQAFHIAKALQQVAQRHYPDLKIDVFETRGSLHNASLLDQGVVQLGTVQADQASGRKARLVAELLSRHLPDRGQAGQWYRLDRRSRRQADRVAT
jgi:hypothetical protein